MQHNILVGDICALKALQAEWRLGRILQFSYFLLGETWETLLTYQIIQIRLVLRVHDTHQQDPHLYHHMHLNNILLATFTFTKLPTQVLASSDLSPPDSSSHSLTSTLSGSSVSNISVTEASTSQCSFSLACSESPHA